MHIEFEILIGSAANNDNNLNENETAKIASPTNNPTVNANQSKLTPQL